MSIGSLGIVGSLAGTSLAQKGAEVDKTQREDADAARQAEAAVRAEAAAGIGTTEEEAQAGDRDADGRRLWERPARSKAAEENPNESAASTSDSVPAKDPTGLSGQTLDLTG